MPLAGDGRGGEPAVAIGPGAYGRARPCWQLARPPWQDLLLVEMPLLLREPFIEGVLPLLLEQVPVVGSVLLLQRSLFVRFALRLQRGLSMRRTIFLQ